MARSWRVARSLDKLLAQINAYAPRRSKRSDGSIGDAAHSARKSDHNPDSRGIVHARDFTHDPRGGFDAHAYMRRLAKAGDRRIKYLISNRQIFNPSLARRWRPYAGANPHTAHAHVSCVYSRLEDDTSAWPGLGGTTTVPSPTPPTTETTEKGFFGMSGYEQRSRVSDQTIKPRTRTRVRLHPATKTSAGPHYIARPRRRGQKFMLQADATLASVPAGADVKAQIIIVYYFKGGGSEITRPFEEHSFPAGTGGWSSVHVPQVEQFGGTQPGGKRGSKTVSSVEYQLEIANHSASPVTVKRVRSAAFYE